MMKKAFLLVAILSSGTVLAQSVTPEVIASSGTTFTSGASQLDWTLGESFTATLTAGTDLLTQGFHQPNLVVTALADASEEHSMRVFPNPTVDQVHLQFETEQASLRFDLMSVDGKILYSQRATNLRSADIDMQPYPSGTYLLSVKEQNSEARIYQIIKLN